MSEDLEETILFIRTIRQDNALQAAFDFIEAMRTLQTMAGHSQEALGNVSDNLLAIASGECEECGGPCRWEYADRYSEDEQ